MILSWQPNLSMCHVVLHLRNLRSSTKGLVYLSWSNKIRLWGMWTCWVSGDITCHTSLEDPPWTEKIKPWLGRNHITLKISIFLQDSAHPVVCVVIVFEDNMKVKYKVKRFKRNRKSQWPCKWVCLLTCFVCVCPAVKADAPGSGTVSA